jgi:L-alanine-DL-glutamate epimerase-like enolase superfamily enzyme
MDVMKLNWQRQRLRPRYSFATSGWVTEEKETIIVALEHDGVVGHGEIVPSALYGQTLESAEATLATLPLRADDDPFAIEALIDRLIGVCDGARATIDGIDAALHDWCGKRAGLPAWRMLGLRRPQTRTTFTIGIAAPDELRKKVAEALAAGYDALKVKVGVENDEETLAHIRAVFDGPLYLDANGAWTPDDAPQRMRALAVFEPTLIEQPLAREHWEHLGALRELGIAPIFADESCERPADVVRLRGHVDGINIKFNKCGGLRVAWRMVSIARALGMQVMFGCFVSGSLAIAPALTLSSLADHADLDGALLLERDPFTGIARTGSVLSLGDRPGLGVEPRDDG